MLSYLSYFPNTKASSSSSGSTFICLSTYLISERSVFHSRATLCSLFFSMENKWKCISLSPDFHLFLVQTINHLQVWQGIAPSPSFPPLSRVGKLRQRNLSSLLLYVVYKTPEYYRANTRVLKTCWGGKNSCYRFATIWFTTSSNYLSHKNIGCNALLILKSSKLYKYLLFYYWKTIYEWSKVKTTKSISISSIMQRLQHILTSEV